MEILIESYVYLLVIMALYAASWFLLSVIVKRNDIADIAWGLGFLLVTGSTYIRYGIHIDRGFLITMLVAVWAIRLSLHIFVRIRKKAEDHRYAQWRKDWGRWFALRSFVQVYLLQGVLMLMVVLPAIIVTVFRGANTVTIMDIVGILLWSIGFFFESLGDYQLAVFLRDMKNKGHIIQTGLWRYSRHPNYFGEVLMWWGIGCLALSVPGGWIGLVGPMTITILIVFVSGIPLLEKKYSGNPEFEKYKKNTSVFFPLPPGKP